MKTFTYTALPWRVLFGRGAVGAVSQEVLRLGASRVLMVTGPDPKNRFSAVADALGALVVARFDGATMHTPTDITARALKVAKANAVDCIVSVGGGSSTGLSKALAVRAGYVQVVVPTTYAGSEVTPVLGEIEGRAELLQSAWLAGMCMASVPMGLHHKLCHVLGGTFAMPHAPTHTVVLPHVMAYNRSAVPEVMRRIADVIGVPDAAAGVHDLVATLGGPTSLQELGFRREDVQRAAELTTSQPYPNPRAVTRGGIVELLGEALAGRRPVDGP
jgi:alcohol dehydrogenase class IV